MTNYQQPANLSQTGEPVDDGDHTRSARRAVLWVARAVTYLVYAYVVFVEIILLLGFFMLLFGANPSSSFVEWVYRSLDRVMEPFRGMFTPIELGTTNNQVESIFETSVLFAMIIYAILGIAISALIGWLTGRINRIDWENREHDRQVALARGASAYGTPYGTPTAPRPDDPAGSSTPPPPGTPAG